MNSPRSIDPSVHSIAFRKVLMVACAVVLFAGFIPVLLHYKGLIDVESFGVPENYLYIGGLGASVVGLISIFIVWRCPACGSYLGKEGQSLSLPEVRGEIQVI